MVKERLSDLKMETLISGIKMEEGELNFIPNLYSWKLINILLPGSGMKLSYELEPLDHESDILSLGKQFKDQVRDKRSKCMIVMNLEICAAHNRVF